MPSRTILIDQDGPLADFERGFYECWRLTYPDAPHIPVSERRVFKIKDEYPDPWRAKAMEMCQSVGFYRDLPVVDGALAAIGEMERLGWEVFVCTSPLTEYRHCVVEKFVWVERHLGARYIKRLILTKDKTLIKGDLLIDDAPDVRGLILTPEWRRIMFDAPYNRTVTGVPRLNWQNWSTVLNV